MPPSPGVWSSLTWWVGKALASTHPWHCLIRPSSPSAAWPGPCAAACTAGPCPGPHPMEALPQRTVHAPLPAQFTRPRVPLRTALLPEARTQCVVRLLWGRQADGSLLVTVRVDSWGSLFIICLKGLLWRLAAVCCMPGKEPRRVQGLMPCTFFSPSHPAIPPGAPPCFHNEGRNPHACTYGCATQDVQALVTTQALPSLLGPLGSWAHRQLVQPFGGWVRSGGLPC